MKKIISALVLASFLAVTTASGALADMSEQGKAHQNACVHGIVAIKNKNCGFEE
jgi:predicted small secreted protein